MMRQTDIVIAGGGIAGLTLGILLAQGGIQVDLIDPAPPPAPDVIKPSGRTAALFGSSVDIIRQTGIWSAIEPYSGRMETMRIIDSHGRESPSADFEAGEIGKAQFGYNVPNGLLRSALYQRAKKIKNLTLHVPGRVESFDAATAHIRVNLHEGRPLHAALLVGADGRNSPVRAQAGIAAQEKTYPQSALTFLINHSRSHGHISTEFHRPGGVLALVPLPGNQSSVVWIEAAEQAQALIGLKKQEFEQALAKATDNLLGGVTLETPPECWPLSALKAKRLTGTRLALIAEAAHVLSPVAAQGLNLSLRDVAALADLAIRHKKLGLDIGSVTMLREYERARRGDVTLRSFGVDALSRAAGNDNPIINELRQIGMKTLKRAGPFKRLMMRQALDR